MPIKLKKTSSTSVVTGNSVLFNGTNQYLSVANNAALALGTGDFTVECWFKVNNNSAAYWIVDSRNVGSDSGFNIFLETSSGYNVRVYTNGAYLITGTAITIAPNIWYHVAFVRNSGTSTIYVNGQIAGSASDSTNYTQPGVLRIGVGWNLNNWFPGYISNLRIVKGTALYTTSFTPPTAPLTAIANTSLLTCQSATIIDNSTNNFTITNNNTATVSSAITPFSASLAYGGTNFKKNIYPRVGRSVQFNGSNYLNCGSNALFSFGTGNFTVEGWMYMTELNRYNALFSNGEAVVGAVALYTLTNNKLSFAEYYGTDVNGSTTLSINTWYHVAVTRSGSTVRLFLNGNIENTNASDSFNNTTNNLIIGNAWGTTVDGNGTFKGYISNFRVVKGTALYTASFTAPTAPLTAISGTSLLTCQSPTIIDNSSNNFTITNNNTAVVSATNPFGADTTGGGMGMKKSAAVVYLTQKAIFGYGNDNVSGFVSTTNLVSNTGVVATDTTGVGTARANLAAAGYGGDKAIFGYGFNGDGLVSMTNLVSNAGVVATDTTGVGTARYQLAAAGYGTDKAIFGYGNNGSDVSTTNLVSNTGVVATDTTGVGTARSSLAAAAYGTNKALFGYGNNGSNVSITNLVSNTGVVATDTTGVGTARKELAAAGYGSDKAIFGYGLTTGTVSMTNLVSNTGVVATDTAGVGTSRRGLAAAGYGTGKVIFGYGRNTVGTVVSMTNLVSNTGVVSTDTTGVGTARWGLTAAGYSLT
jgi:hypothetical protein